MIQVLNVGLQRCKFWTWECTNPSSDNFCINDLWTSPERLLPVNTHWSRTSNFPRKLFVSLPGHLWTAKFVSKLFQHLLFCVLYSAFWIVLWISASVHQCSNATLHPCMGTPVNEWITKFWGWPRLLSEGFPVINSSPSPYPQNACKTNQSASQSANHPTGTNLISNRNFERSTR